MKNSPFKFTLWNRTRGSQEISEPDGWKDVTLKLERHPDFHSLVEYFEGSFVFYGENNVDNGGADFIRQVESQQGASAAIDILIEFEDCATGVTTTLNMPSLSEWRTRSSSAALRDWTIGSQPSVTLTGTGFPNTSTSELLYVHKKFEQGRDYTVTITYTKVVNVSHSNPRTIKLGVYDRFFNEIFSDSTTTPTSPGGSGSLTLSFRANSSCEALAISGTDGSNVTLTVNSVSGTIANGDHILFAGQLDLTELKEVFDNKIRVPIIRSDMWAKFIARQAVQVDLRSDIDLDGGSVLVPDTVDVELTSQVIRMAYNATSTTPGSTSESGTVITAGTYYQMSWDNATLNEIKEVFGGPQIDNPDLPGELIYTEYAGLYTFEIQTVAYDYNPAYNFGIGEDLSDYIRFYLNIDDVEHEFTVGSLITSGLIDGGRVYTMSLAQEVRAGAAIRIYGKAIANLTVGGAGSYNGEIRWNGPIVNSDQGDFECYCRITADTTYPTTTAQGFLIHDAAAAIIARITSKEITTMTEQVEALTINQKEQRLRELCHHEAGHAVMATFLGRDFDYITIVPDGGAAGYLQPKENDAVKSFWELVCLVEINLAGGVAQARYAKKKVDDVLPHMSGDMQNIIEMLRANAHIISHHEAPAFMEWLMKRTEQHVEERWKFIGRVAVKLHEKKTLTCQEVKDIVGL